MLRLRQPVGGQERHVSEMRHLRLDQRLLMTRLGAIQRRLVAFLTRCGDGGAYIGSSCRAEELRGYDLDQVLRARDALLPRGVLRVEGIRTILMK